MKKASILLVLALLIGFPVLAQEVEEPRNVKEDPEDMVESGPGTAKQESDKLYNFGININYWDSSYLGDIEVRNESELPGFGSLVFGEEASLEDDFGLDTGVPIIEPEIWFSPSKKHRVILSWFQVFYEGEETQDQPLEFGGYAFAANSEISTDFRIDRWRILHEWTPLMADYGKLGINYGIEYYFWRMDYEGYAETGAPGVTKKVSGTEVTPIFIPTVGISGALEFGYGLGLFGRFSGIAFSYEDWEASYTDFEGGAKFDYKNLHFSVGYRVLTSDFEGEEDEGGEKFKIDWHTSHEGFLATLGVRF